MTGFQSKCVWLYAVVMVGGLATSLLAADPPTTDAEGLPAETAMSPEEMIQQASQMLEEAKAMLNEQKKTQQATASDGFSKFDALIAGLSIFVLAIFVGFEVITKVPPTLHTPLMSGSNAISGITLVGALIVAGRYGSLLGVLAVIFATINVIGGFWVTHRMLSMFRR